MGFTELSEGAIPALDGRPLIGRDRDLAKIKSHLETARHVCITGCGGIGKTRLALQIAHDCNDERDPFDSVPWVSLADIDDSQDEPDETVYSRVVGTIARAMHLRDNARALEAIGPDDEDKRPRLLDELMTTLADALRDAGRTLLVIDNCEHVEEAAALAISRLLGLVPTLTVLTTSQIRLGLDAEQTYRLDPLAIPVAGDPASADKASVQLLTLRVKEQDLNFSVTEENLSDVVQLVEAVGGLPLCLRMVARQVAASSPEDVVQDTSSAEGLLLLSGGDKYARASHERLELAMRWMWDLAKKKPKEQIAWARLSEFRGEFGRDAAIAVIADDHDEGIRKAEVPNLLTCLFERSVLEIRRVNGRVLYSLLEPVRALGQQELARRGESTEIRTRALRHYSSLGHTARRSWLGPTELKLLTQWRGNSNLNMVLEHALEHDPAQGLELITNILASRGGIYEGIMGPSVAWIERLAAQIPPDQQDPELMAVSMATAAWLRCLLGDRPGAHTAIDQANAYEQQCGRELPAVTYYRAVYHWWALEQPDQALDGLLKAAAAFGSADPEGKHLAEVYGLLCAALYNRLDIARGLVDNVVADARRSGGQWAQSWSDYAQMTLRLREAETADPEQRKTLLDEAKRLADKSATLWREIDDRWSLSWANAGFAGVLCAMGEYRLTAVMLGATDRTQHRTDEQITSLPGVREFVAGAEAQARKRLGDAAYDAAYEEGWTLGPQALDLGLAGHQNPLTAANWRVVRWLPSGLTNREIAAEVHLSKRTVEEHITIACEKTGKADRAELTQWARNQKGHVKEPPRDKNRTGEANRTGGVNQYATA